MDDVDEEDKDEVDEEDKDEVDEEDKEMDGKKLFFSCPLTRLVHPAMSRHPPRGHSLLCHSFRCSSIHLWPFTKASETAAVFKVFTFKVSLHIF